MLTFECIDRLNQISSYLPMQQLDFPLTGIAFFKKTFFSIMIRRI